MGLTCCGSPRQPPARGDRLLLTSVPYKASNSQCAGGEAEKVLRRPEESSLTLGMKKVRFQSREYVPSSRGLVPSQAPSASPAPHVPLLCPVCYFIISA